MRRLHSLLRMILLTVAAGAGPAVAQPPEPGPIPADEGGAVGYQHGVERSRFAPGAERRQVEEHGFRKVVSPTGVFATRLHNGLVIAAPTGGVDKGAAGDRAEPRRDYLKDPDRHNQEVVDYFTEAGLPRDQIHGVHANTYLSSSGSLEDERPAPPRVDGYASVLERRVESFLVVDSVAWASLSENGEIISEWVYWPAIPAKVLEDAKRLDEVSRTAEFRARLPSGSPPGRVVIRHSSATADGDFEIFASYDVIERRTSADATERSFPPLSSTVVRHFGVDGIERRLPQERREAEIKPLREKAP